MGHYAKVVDGKVVDVITATQDFFIDFVDTSPGEWIKTSYNTKGGIHYEPDSDIPSPDQSKSLRKNYAGIGYSYDRFNDAFIPPKPFEGWVLNEQTYLWQPPVPYPNDGKDYVWDNLTESWKAVD
jgi:hypothetical protein